MSSPSLRVALLVMLVACGGDEEPEQICGPEMFGADCTAWTECLPGEYVVTAGTATSDRACAACPVGTYSAMTNAEMCTAWDTCVAGEHVAIAGMPTTDRMCEACTAGTYSSTENADACAGWSTCVAGDFIASDGSADRDRTCADCAAGTFSTMTNATACAAWQTCMPGQRVAMTGTSTSDRTCAECATGTYSATPNAAMCTAWSTCVAGEYVSAAGMPSSDRMCSACAAGTFSTTTNAAACANWTACASNQSEDIPGTATSDRTCALTAWMSQFGSSSIENVYALARNGRALAVVGDTMGTLPNQTSSGQFDAFVRTYTSAGTPGWTRQFGTAGQDQAVDAAVDASGNVYVVGTVQGALPGQTHSGGNDAFVRAYNANGTVRWTRQYGTAAADTARAVAIDALDRLVVAGDTGGTLPGQTNAGSQDSYVRWYALDGTLISTVQFGTTAADYLWDVAADSTSHVYVGGEVAAGGAYPGNTASGNIDAYLRKLTPGGVAVWTRQFGTTTNDGATSIVVASNDDPIVAGATQGVLGQANFGGTDMFVRRYASDGTVRWTRQIGTSGVDVAHAITMASDGSILGTGRTATTSSDVMYWRVDANGVQLTTQQFGTSGQDTPTGIATDVAGNFILAGNTQGTMPGGTSAGSFDAFITRRPALP